MSENNFTPEKAGLPDMNVTLNYENPTNNGIALVTKALMYESIQAMNDTKHPMIEEDKAEILDILYNPGYAPMERLVIAMAYVMENPNPYNLDPTIYNIDPSAYVVDFANDWERLAFAICPNMFAKSVSNDEAAEPANPGHEGTGN